MQMFSNKLGLDFVSRIEKKSARDGMTGEKVSEGGRANGSWQKWAVVKRIKKNARKWAKQRESERGNEVSHPELN